MLVHPNPGRVVWPAAMIVWGPGFTSAGHSHHSVQLIMALRGHLLIRGGAKGEWRKCGAALVRPDAAHEVDARSTTVLTGFVDSESELGTALVERIEGEIFCIPENQVARWRAALGPTLTESRVERWVRTELLHRHRALRAALVCGDRARRRRWAVDGGADRRARDPHPRHLLRDGHDGVVAMRLLSVLRGGRLDRRRERLAYDYRDA